MKDLNELYEEVTADGIIDAQEVAQIEAAIYDPEGDEGEAVSRAEADFIFRVNDAVSGNDNCPEWKDCVVKAISSHVLDDETSPNVLDEDEAAWLIGKIEGDGQVDEVEIAIIANIFNTAESCHDSFIEFGLNAVKAAVIADGVIDPDEVRTIRNVIYGPGGDEGEGVSRREADFLFAINDTVSGNENSPEWGSLFVEAISSHVLADETSPNVLDEDEAAWLTGKIEGDGVVDSVELSLIVNLFHTAESCHDSFIEFGLNAVKEAVIADGIIDADEVQTIKKVIYGSGGDEGEAVSRREADFLFDINDQVTGHDNCPQWQELMVDAICSHLLDDEVSPGEVDEDEGDWLVGRIEGDGTYDEVEKAVLTALNERAAKISGKLQFKIRLFVDNK